MPSNKTLVLDTSAIITGLPLLLNDVKCYITPEILEEANRMIHQNTLLEAVQHLHIHSPSIIYLSQVRQLAVKLGESLNLSKADISLLALALEFSKHQEVEILSDDYSIENLAFHLGLKCNPSATHGITHTVRWKFYCKGCKKEYRRPPSSGVCVICGSKISRKPLYKKNLKGEK